MALDALYKAVLNNFPFLIKHNIKVGSKLEKILLIFNLGSAHGNQEQSIMAEMCDVEVMAIDGDIATFKYKVLKVSREYGTPLILSRETTMDISLSSLVYR